MKGITNCTGLSARARARRVGSSPGVGEALGKLAADSRDAGALIAVYDEYSEDLKASAVRWFGRNPEVRNKAINNILAAIGRQASNYDPESMDAAEWVRQCADTEAKKLREALDA